MVQSASSFPIRGPKDRQGKIDFQNLKSNLEF